MTRIPAQASMTDLIITHKAEQARKAQGLARAEFVARLGYENIGQGCRKYTAFLEGNFIEEADRTSHLGTATMRIGNKAVDLSAILAQLGKKHGG